MSGGNTTYEMKSSPAYTVGEFPLQDPYTIPGNTARTSLVVPEKNPKKMSCITKLLIAGWIVNFVLIIATAVSLSFFLSRAATKSEVGVVSQGLQATESPGPAGPPGPIGQTGAAGTPGIDGRTGLPGPPGSPGASGERGMIGDRGLAGPAGNTGSTGAPGENGERGMVGLMGDSGPMGDTGATGSTGAPGEIGDTGVAGPMGDPGPAGPTGETGLAGPPGSPAAIVGGVTYNRWGNTACPTGAELTYSGRTGSTATVNQGGASNYVCMPDNPDYPTAFQAGEQGYSYVFGTEYQDPLVPGRNEHNSACAVCYLPTKHAVITIPAKTVCPSGWTREYHGYLMSEARLHQRTMFECVDISMEAVPGSQNDDFAGLFYHVEAHCSGLACPPYSNERELGCVVCSK